MAATTVELRKFRVGRVIGRSFSMLFRNIGPVGLVALAMLSLPYVLGYFLGIRYSSGPLVESEPHVWPSRVTLLITIESFLNACLHAVLAVGVYETLQGRRRGAWALVRGGFARLPAALSVVIVVTALAALVELQLAASVHTPWLMADSLAEIIPGLIFMYVFGIFALFAYVFLFVAIPAAAVEGLGMTRSIGRSVELVRSSIFRVIGLILATGVITGAVLLTPIGLVHWAGIDRAALPDHLLLWPDLLLSAFLAALWAVVGTVAYHDLRRSREGLTLTRAAGVFD